LFSVISVNSGPEVVILQGIMGNVSRLSIPGLKNLKSKMLQNWSKTKQVVYVGCWSP
jgi:hypothetical protein